MESSKENLLQRFEGKYLLREIRWEENDDPFRILEKIYFSMHFLYV